MQQSQSPEEKTEHQVEEQESGPSPGKAPFLLFIYIGLSVAAVVAVLLLFGPSQRMTDGRPAPSPAPSAPRAERERAEQPDSPFVYEEHLGEDAGSGGGMAGAGEARGAVVAPRPQSGNSADAPSQVQPQAETVPGEDATPGKMDGGQGYKRVASDQSAQRPAPKAADEKASGEASQNADDVKAGPVMAIVIDDLGDSAVFAKALLDLDFPVTLAIMPYRTRSPKVAELAVSAGAEVILHQPMEPLAYPKTDPGKGALFVGMSPGKIASVLERNLAQVPGADGVNNHMGSKFTQDYAGMAEVMSFLANRGLFFLDSVTSAGGAAPAAAKNEGAPMVSRNVFLDNSRSPNAIAGQLLAAQNIAKSRGQAVAIGHPYKETLAALRWWASHRDPAVRLVYLRDLPALAD